MTTRMRSLLLSPVDVRSCRGRQGARILAMSSWLIITGLLFLFSPTVLASDEQPANPEPTAQEGKKDQYIVVSKPGRSDKPDEKEVEGEIKSKFRTRTVIEVPAGKSIEKIRAHDSVKFIQFIVPSATAQAMGPHSGATVQQSRGEEDSSTASSSEVTPRATWNWSSGNTGTTEAETSRESVRTATPGTTCMSTTG